MRILVTGSSGFLGSRLASALRKDHPGEVVGVDPRPGPQTNRLGIASEECRGEAVDLLYHCGGMIDVTACQRDPIGAWEANVVESVRLARQVSVKKLFVYLGTYAALTPKANIYSRVKAETDFWLSQVGMPYASITLVNTYGFGGSGVVSKFLFSRSPKVRGGSQVREWVYVDDVVEFLIQVGMEGLRGIHLVGGEKASVNDIAAMCGRPDLPHEDALPFEIEAPLSYKPTFRGPTRLKDGIAKMVSEAEETGLTHYFGGKEVGPRPR